MDTVEIKSNGNRYIHNDGNQYEMYDVTINGIMVCTVGGPTAVICAGAVAQAIEANTMPLNARSVLEKYGWLKESQFNEEIKKLGE